MCLALVGGSWRWATTSLRYSLQKVSAALWSKTPLLHLNLAPLLAWDDNDSNVQGIKRDGDRTDYNPHNPLANVDGCSQPIPSGPLLTPSEKV